MLKHNITISLFTSCLLMACSDNSDVTASKTSQVEYTSIKSETSSSYARLSLCELAGRMHSAGYYEVSGLFGVSEEDLRTQTTRGFTYVHLNRIESWSGNAPNRTILRIEGGPLDNGDHTPWSVSLTRGDRYGMILSHPHELNRGAMGVGPIGLFTLNHQNNLTNEVYLPPNGRTHDFVKEHVSDAFDGCRLDLEPYDETSTPPEDEGPSRPAEEEMGGTPEDQEGG